MSLWFKRNSPADAGRVDASASAENGIYVPSEHDNGEARRLGDDARDRGAWDEAIRLYEQHLAAIPNDTAIWIQLGHARKESGSYHEAGQAYETALSLDDKDADLLLQIGHLHKIIGNQSRAMSFYARALKLDDQSPAYQELTALNQRARADAIISSHQVTRAHPITYIQINDLLHFLRHNKSVSGIQRVQVAFVEYCLIAAKKSDDNIQFVFNRDDEHCLWTAASADLIELVGYLNETDIDQNVLIDYVSRIERMGVPVHPKRGDVVVILGAFWGIDGNTRLLAALKSSGVTVGIYIYDLIPITHPEFCSQHLTNDFTVDLCEALQLIDFALTISDYTKRELEAFITKHSFPQIPVIAVPLAHKLTGIASDKVGQIATRSQLAGLQGKEYVLCVCTIEPRKNHRYLLDVWKLMHSSGENVPLLVFVGRKGWHVEDLMSQIKNTESLKGLLVLLHDLSDIELAELYQNCLFTVFPSIVEGWGLPIGESLSYGKLCVASDQTSMPEVGQSLVEYIDPFNVRSGVQTIQRLLANPNLVKLWEDRIKTEFHPRTWNDVCSQFFREIKAVNVSLGDSRQVPFAKIHVGQVLKINSLRRGLKANPDLDFRDLTRLIIADGFYTPEDFGAWVKGRQAVLRFKTGLPQSQSIVVYLQFVKAPNVDQLEVRITHQDQTPAIIVFKQVVPSNVKVPVETDMDGLAEIQIEVLSAYDQAFHAPRDFCLGLTAIGFAPVTDAVGRLDILESLTGHIIVL